MCLCLCVSVSLCLCVSVYVCLCVYVRPASRNEVLQNPSHGGTSATAATAATDQYWWFLTTGLVRLFASTPGECM